MKRLPLIGLLLLASVWRLAGQIAPFANPDFELGKPGETPQGWFVPKFLANAGFTAALTKDRPHSGEMCTEIRWPTNQAPAGTFANLMQSVDAVPWRGKRLKIIAAIRVGSTGAVQRAQMWARVDLPGVVGDFDNMADRPVQKTTWADYSITLEIPDEAQTLNIGLMTFNGATALFDNVRVEVINDFVTLREPPRPLDDSGLRNLVAFTRLLGFVRHYHPDDKAATNDWLSFAVQSLPEVESARGSDALAIAIDEAFRVVAPTVQVFQKGKQPELPTALLAPAGRDTRTIRYWEHIGYSRTEEVSFGNVYRSRRLSIAASEAQAIYAQPTNVFRADLVGGVACAVPTALYVDRRATVSGANSIGSKPDAKEVRYSVAHRGARLATVMLAWNIWKHFYPYVDIVGTDWDKELEIALQSAATDEDESAFARTLNRMVVQLHDGHAHLFGPGVRIESPPGAKVELIEGKVVITGVPLENSDLKLGDVVERIDGRPAVEVFDEIVARISGATVQWRNYRAQAVFGSRPTTERPIYEVRGADGTLRAVKVTPTEAPPGAALLRPAKLTEIKPGIYYVDVTRLTQEEFDAALPELAKRKG